MREHCRSDIERRDLLHRCSEAIHDVPQYEHKFVGLRDHILTDEHFDEFGQPHMQANL